MQTIYDRQRDVHRDLEEWVECGASKKSGFVRNIMVKPSDVNKFRFSNNNIGVFCTPYIYASRDQKKSFVLSDFYLDLDGEELKNVLQDTIRIINYLWRLYEIKPTDMKFYFSGSKGIHIIIPKEVFGIEFRPDLNVVFKLMAEEIKINTESQSIDTKIYDKRRLFRLPNSVHEKSSLYKIPLLLEEIINQDINNIYEMAKEPRAIEYNNPTYIKAAANNFLSYTKRIIRPKRKIRQPVIKDKSYTPPCIEKILNTVTKEGNRNDSLAALTSYYYQRHYSLDKVITLLSDWGNNNCDPPIKEEEITSTVNSMYHNGYKTGCTWMKNISDCNPDCILRRRARS